MALCQACCVKAHPQACTHLVQQPVEDPAEHGEQAGNEQGKRVVIVAVPQQEILGEKRRIEGVSCRPSKVKVCMHGGLLYPPALGQVQGRV